ncbi:hypothetical protein PC110_g17451 [Phytophthora cactorum]|uniref:Uncharacterized protein n=5 Tax=Phytophthora cactorum TaxID=29920 RepID=A0A329RN43_9STRA|nr:hypothetical protein PC110_g22302 [Phytophthora cactorum]RAW21317.1 hypothetical protein PC110_g22240 [Phytophthora cactorum]RAW22686.1 hypothetical protein PC110_g20874 [Phytophthora cactorum]RAW26143.1 hypothetical protein PC110_g17451 [Phytophthora cactorum]
MGGNTWSLRPHQAITLPALVDDMMSITYRQSRFGEARTKISALLLDLQTPISLTGAVDRIFRVFMVQLQETIIASELGSHQQQARILEGSKWCRRWLLEPGSLHVVDVESGASFSISLLSLTQLIRNFGCIDVKVTQRAVHSMSLRAAFPLSTGMTAPMNLVLDGRIRVFRALPSGISSRIAVGGWSVGDYSTTYSRDGLSIDMNFFAFDDRDGRRDDVTAGVNTTAVHRTSLSLVLDQDTETMGEGDPRDLFIIVQGTVCSARARGVEMSEMSSSSSAVLWNQLSWMSILEVQAGYVAL